MVCAGASRVASLIGGQGVWMSDKRVYGGFGISPVGSGEPWKVGRECPAASMLR